GLSAGPHAKSDVNMVIHGCLAAASRWGADSLAILARAEKLKMTSDTLGSLACRAHSRDGIKRRRSGPCRTAEQATQAPPLWPGHQHDEHCRFIRRRINAAH